MKEQTFLSLTHTHTDMHGEKHKRPSDTLTQVWMALQELRNLAAGCFLYSSVNHSSLTAREEGSDGWEKCRKSQRWEERERERERDSLLTHFLAIIQEHSVLVCFGGNREYVSIPQDPDLSVHLLILHLWTFTSLCVTYTMWTLRLQMNLLK